MPAPPEQTADAAAPRLSWLQRLIRRLTRREPAAGEQAAVSEIDRETRKTL